MALCADPFTAESPSDEIIMSFSKRELALSVALRVLLGFVVLPAAVAQESQPSPVTVRFSGRVLSADGPLEGVRIEAIDTKFILWPYQRLVMERERAAQLEASAKSLGQSVFTDAEGRFRLSVPVAEGRRKGLGFRILSRSHASVLLFPTGPFFDSECALDDIQLKPGGLIRGLVEFASSARVAERPGRLLRSSGSQSLSALWTQSARQVVMGSQIVPIRCDTNGSFETDWALDLGADAGSTWTFVSNQNDCLSSNPLVILPSFLEAQQLLLLIPGSLLRISGRVEDHAGRPLRGVTFRLSRDTETSAQSHKVPMTSDAKGNFQIEAILDDPPTWRLHASLFQHEHRVDLGTHGQGQPQNGEAAHVVLIPSHEILVIARRAEDGLPLSNFRVRRTIGHTTRVESNRFDRARMDQSCQIEVLPLEEDLATTTPHVLPPFEVHREVVIEVPRRIRRQISVQDAAGRPIANASIRVILPWPEAAASKERLGWQPGNAWPKVGLVRETLETDAAGRAVISGAEGVPLELQIEARGLSRQLFSRITMDREVAPLLLRLEGLPAFVISGQLNPRHWHRGYQKVREESLKVKFPADLYKRLPWTTPGLGLAEVSDAQSPTHLPERGAIQVAEDGSFAVEGVPPGHWQLGLRTDAWFLQERRPGFFPLTAPLPVRAGERQTINCDLSAVLPAEVRVRLQVNGKPFFPSMAHWWGRPQGHSTASLFEAIPKVDANSWRTFLPPGDYHLRIAMPSHPTEQVAFNWPAVPITTLAKGVTLKSGSVHDLEAAIQVHRGTVLRCVRPGTQIPIPGAMVLLRCAPTDPGLWIGPASTGGLITLPDLVAGRHEILCLPAAITATMPLWAMSCEQRIIWGLAAELHSWAQHEAALRRIGLIDVTQDDQLFEVRVPADLSWW